MDKGEIGMVTFYIDESGKIKDKDQPTFLFCGVGIRNDIYNLSNEFMKNESNKTRNTIIRKINNILNQTTTAETKKQDICKMLTENLFNKFEIHAKELIHGKKEFVFLSKSDKYKIIERICNFIKENSIPVIIIKVERNVLNSDTTIKDKNQYVIDTMNYNLVNQYEEFLERKKEQGILIFDNGNEFIQHNFVEYAKTNMSRCISPHIVQADSCETPLLQMADIIAYIAGIYFNKRSKYNTDLKPYYEIIKDNIILLDVSKKNQDVENNKIENKGIIESEENVETTKKEP